MRAALALLLALLLPLGGSAAATRPQPGTVRVALTTTAGTIVVALDARHAPRTTANFLRYCDETRLDGTTFYRAAREADRPTLGFIEGGIGGDVRRALDAVPLEPTSRTGLHHVDGTISMARWELPNTGTANFSILSGPSPRLDAHPGDLGYAAFGHVIRGMDVVRRILAMPTVGIDTLAHPVRIITARRLDGRAGPVPKFKPWLIRYPH